MADEMLNDLLKMKISKTLYAENICSARNIVLLNTHKTLHKFWDYR